jgi:signal transduction histidine kinase
MILSVGFMIIGSIAIGSGAMIAINGLHQDLSIAVQGYQQLRQLYNVGYLASRARDAISANPPRPLEAQAALRSARTMLNDRSQPYSVDGPPAKWIHESERADCDHLLSDAIAQIDQSRSPSELNLLFSRMSKVSDNVRASISEAQSAADRKRRLTLETVLAMSLIVITGTILLGLVQYRGVIAPLRNIGDGVRGFALGNFDRRISAAGDLEFVALANDFNHMADELWALYRNLEQQVRQKSRELVRSERLASVGYLAAGVAHEINNPLGIIAGYAQRALQQMEADTESSAKMKKALTVICEEAFRCKQITDRLLSLARPGSSARQAVSLAAIAREVIETVTALGSADSRIFSVKFDPDADLTVLASEGEIKQVVLNLVINATQAVNTLTSRVEVEVEVKRASAGIELSVTDNGQGMTPETAEHVFEPFFSMKKGERTGTGLGLSIAHAIVTDHGGTIRAFSEGLGKGSRFTMTLPPAMHGASDAAS